MTVSNYSKELLIFVCTTDFFYKFFFNSSDNVSKSMFKNSYASCYSKPENEGKLWSIAFLNYSGANALSF